MSKGISNASDGCGFVASDPARSEKQQGRFPAQDGSSADVASSSCCNGGECADTEDELAAFLSDIEHDCEMQVLQTLKRTEFEVTEKVAYSAERRHPKLCLYARSCTWEQALALRTQPSSKPGKAGEYSDICRASTTATS